jgi:glycosyltransferase involved in cell wall biosynthesis
MSEDAKLLFFSVNEWDNRWRRKQRLAYEFSRQPDVASVLHVNPPLSDSFLDVLRGRFQPGYLGPERRKHWQTLTGRMVAEADGVWSYTGSSKTLPLTRLAALRHSSPLPRINRSLYVQLIRWHLRRLPGKRLVLWLYHPLQADLIDAFPERALLCYDWTDDWAEFDWLPVTDRQELVAGNECILRRADVVFAVSEELLRRAHAANANSYRAPNATDISALGADARDNVALELADLPRPIIGYIGQIGDKIDYAMLEQVIAGRPNWSFVLVGNVWASKKMIVDALAVRPNVYLMGQRAYDELGGFMQGFDVCILPHLRTSLTRSMDPIKLYDYLASGKPIVSTRVAGTERFADVVYIGDTSEEFVAALDRALAEDGALTERRLAYARRNTWPQRTGEMWQIVQQHLPCL